ncbi:hypothetical protein MKW92_019744 [Papaver armeniacum]|nr:hypothetical protein MKW92_019744 [Papaver armeniacum]
MSGSQKKRSREVMESNDKGRCIIEYDGAAKGNPGPAGAGAVLRHGDGSVITRLHAGLGHATNNEAEYRGLLLGMKHAHKEGYKQISVQGDSKLVDMQVKGQWKTKNENMAKLCREVQGYKDKFQSFDSSHAKRDYNRDADAQANLGVKLRKGEVVVWDETNKVTRKN